MKSPFVRRKKYDKLLNEYEEVVYKLECLLCHTTGNKLSKHTYTLETMEDAVTDHVEDLCNEAGHVISESRLTTSKRGIFACPFLRN